MRQNFGRPMDFLIAPWKAFAPQEAKTLPTTFCFPYLGGVPSPQPRCPLPACWRAQPAEVNEKLSLGRMPTAISTLLVTESPSQPARRDYSHLLSLTQSSDKLRSWKVQELCRNETCALLVQGPADSIARFVLLSAILLLFVSSKGCDLEAPSQN